MRFFDTNVLVYCFDADEPAKQSMALALVRDAIADSTFVLSTQVMQEFYQVVLRRGLLAANDAADVLRAWSDHRVVSSHANFVLHAIDLQQKLKISIWDALVAQAALEGTCSELLTEDLQHGMKIGELEVVNPFLQSRAVHEPASAYKVPHRSRATTRAKAGSRR